MKSMLLLAMLTFPFLGLCVESDTSGERRFRRFESFELDVGKIYGFSKEFRQSTYKSYLSFGIGFNFLTFKVGEKLQFTQHVSGTISGRNHRRLIENIEFEGNYLGGLSGDEYRTSLFVGTTLRYTLGDNVEIGFPVNYVARWWGYEGRFYLNEGQNIAPEDVVTNHEANAANKFKIYRNFASGFKTGFELALTAGDRYAIFTSWSFQFFPGMDIYDVTNASFDQPSGELSVPNISLTNGTDMRVVFGIRSYIFTTAKSTPTKKIKDNPEVILTPDKRKK